MALSKKGEEKMKKQKIKTTYLTVTAVMAAVSTITYYVLPEIPLVPGVDYLKIDFSDIPAIATGIMINPFYGILVEVVKNLIHLFKTTTLGIGELMNMGVGAAIILSLSGFSKLFARLFKKDNMSVAVYYSASAVTLEITILAGWLLNGALTPVYFLLMGFPITAQGIAAGVWGSTLLNVVKAALNLLPFYPVFLALKKAFSKISH